MSIECAAIIPLSVRSTEKSSSLFVEAAASTSDISSISISALIAPTTLSLNIIGIAYVTTSFPTEEVYGAVRLFLPVETGTVYQDSPI